MDTMSTEVASMEESYGEEGYEDYGGYDGQEYEGQGYGGDGAGGQKGNNFIYQLVIKDNIYLKAKCVCYHRCITDGLSGKQSCQY